MCVHVLEHWLASSIPIVGNVYKWRFPKLLPIAFDQSGSLYERHRALRMALHAQFVVDPENRAALARWQVINWGGVGSGDPSRIDRFVDVFVSGMRPHTMSGIATWSKIAVLFDPSLYGIYDSRVSVALNALQAMKCGTVCEPFPLAPGKAQTTKAAAKTLKQLHGVSNIHMTTPLNQYERYLALLNWAGDVQAAEMVLFAKAPEIAAQYQVRYGSLAR